ncbi:MAG TPA: PilZ domain-containing protein [Sphingobium sp.]|nr:PilZ domain-containing protein [Sphingobium sp.]
MVPSDPVPGDLDDDEPRRTAKRDSLFLLAALFDEAGLSRGRARVRNLSESGLMADCELRFSVGERIVVTLRGIGEVSGRVAWAKGSMIGMAFDHGVDPQAARKPVTGAGASGGAHQVPAHLRPPPGPVRYRR